MIVRLAKKVFFGRFQKPWRWPDSVSESDWERVQAGRLAGIFGAARREPLGAVVLAHPMGVAAKGFWLKQGHAAILRDAGFHVLAFDFNGFGDSASFDFDYPGDVIRAGVWARDRVAPLPVAVLGCSFGAGYAMCALADEAHPFRAAVLESAFPSLPFYWWPYRIPYLLLRASQVVHPSFERRLRPLSAATKIKHRPTILLIQGEADTVTPPHVAEELRAAIGDGAPVEVWSVRGADHNLALRAHPGDYAKRVTAFLTSALTK